MSARPKILLVDDRAENLVALKAQLRAQPAELLEAGSGDEALELLLSQEVALALVDVQMPEMDGFELAELMRGSERTREIPIIFVTAGLHDRPGIFKGYEAGAVDFLVKPIEPQVLQSKVSVFLQIYEQKRQLAERVQELETAQEALRASEERLSLLSRTAGRLLRTEEPQRVIDELCREVMQHLDCQVFFNYLADPAGGKLRLNAWEGIPEEEARKIAWLEYGPDLCGCVARDGQRLVAEDVLHSEDRRVDRVRSYGIQAYCCHPLVGEGQVLGTLSFGTRNRPQFSGDEVELMRVVADQVATAIQRMEAKRALSLTNAQLLEADRRKDEFLAVLSHELRNPLAPIKNCLYILDKAAPGGDHALRAKATIDRQVNQLARLVDDLLDVTRITRNKIQLQRERLELNELVRRTLEDHRSEFEKAGIRLELGPSPAPVWVNADWNRLAQTIGNLLQNAAKFTPRGGRVAVSLSTHESRGETAIRVSDSGVGMKPETLARLFQPFMQADTSLDRSKGGLGLGLALVKSLVELHGGSVQATSAGLGRGAEFAIRLPLEPASSKAEERPEPKPAQARQRVLIIEDNADAADSLREVLEFEEHEVAVAYNGPSGLAMARAQPPNLVLCDIGLPGMDGYEVARALRAEPALKGVRLVALSGYAAPEDLQRALQAGFDQHMAKPPSLDQIREVLAAESRAPRVPRSMSPVKSKPGVP